MRRLASFAFASALLAGGLLVGGLVTAQEIKTTDPRTLMMYEIGAELKCQCGCAYTVADCNMLYCHFRDPVNQEIGEMIDAGMGKEAIVAALIENHGTDLRTQPPPGGFGAVGWAMPFAVLALGLIAAPFIVQRWRKNQLAAEAAAPATKPIDQETIDRLEAQIERDLGQFE